MKSKVHFETKLKQKRASIRKGVLYSLLPILLIVVGGLIRDQWPVMGGVLGAFGLISSGWIARGVWSAQKINTEFHG